MNKKELQNSKFFITSAGWHPFAFFTFWWLVNLQDAFLIHGKSFIMIVRNKSEIKSRTLHTNISVIFLKRHPWKLLFYAHTKSYWNFKISAWLIFKGIGEIETMQQGETQWKKCDTAGVNFLIYFLKGFQIWNFNGNLNLTVGQIVSPNSTFSHFYLEQSERSERSENDSTSGRVIFGFLAKSVFKILIPFLEIAICKI